MAKTLTLSIPDDLNTKIEDHPKRSRHKTATAFVRQMISEWLVANPIVEWTPEQMENFKQLREYYKEKFENYGYKNQELIDMVEAKIDEWSKLSLQQRQNNGTIT